MLNPSKQLKIEFSDTFHLNPRLSLTLSESDEVILALNQHTAMDPKVIGFTGYQVLDLKNLTMMKSLLPSAYSK
jgi:hypothetical protein